MGMLFHTKQLRTYMERQAASQWKPGYIENVAGKTLAIVGFGDIGAVTGKIAKQGFGCKVIGLKRRPELTSDEDRSCADEVVGLDQMERVLA